MSKGIFDYIVDAQDKTLVGSWKNTTLFILVFLVVIGLSIMMKSMQKKDYIIENVIIFALQIALFAIFVNYITGKIFISREKMYKSKGFSNKSAKGQAYADARLGQFVAAVGGGFM